MSELANIVGYQCVWFIAVLGAARASSWPAVVALVGFGTLQLSLSRRRRADLRTLAASIAAGIVVDGALAHTGLVVYATPLPALVAPLWILAIWSAFGLTLGHSLAFLQRRPWLAASLGAAGAPLAYLAAARVDAIRVDGAGLLAVGMTWAVALPLLSQWSRTADAVEVTA